MWESQCRYVTMNDPILFKLLLSRNKQTIITPNKNVLNTYFSETHLLHTTMNT